MPYEALFAETVLMRGHQGDQIDAYLARPMGVAAAPGMVIIHHMPGWDGPTKEIARRFAHHGYVAISPNLHFREGKATPQDNSASVRAAGGMPDDRTMGDVQGAVDYLRALPYLNGRVGVIGYCSGGRQSYLAACTVRGIDAAIDCYGGGVVAKPEELTPRQPVAPI
jgi:carboxymethylenebutenolidase